MIGPKNRHQRRALQSIERRMAKQIHRIERITRTKRYLTAGAEQAIVRLNALWRRAKEQNLVDDRH